MRVLLLAVLAVAFSDCTFGANTCSPTKPCADGATCDLSGFCIGSTDSGTGGGGSTFNCSPACAEWQRCSPRGCVNARVEAVSPQSGTVYNGGDAVRFVFRVLDWDGGVWPTATIPATTVGGATGPSTLAKMGTTFEGDYVLASVTELQEVRAGWPVCSRLRIARRHG